MKSGVSIVKDNLGKFQKSLGALIVSKVLVGIPAKNAEREPDPENPEPINNAAIGYIMENGAPEHGIPARPFLIPGVRDAQKEIAQKMQSATVNALSGDKAGFNKYLRQAGQIGASAVKNKIDNGPFVALADSTLRARARKQAISGGTKADRKAAKAALASGDYSKINAKPLIDTGQLIAAVTYIVRD